VPVRGKGFVKNLIYWFNKRLENIDQQFDRPAKHISTANRPALPASMADNNKDPDMVKTESCRPEIP
jgi:hypothetical protein